MNNPIFQKIRHYTLLIGEGAFDLGVTLIVMILVQRSLGVGGLGIFSYLISLLMFAGFLSEFGISSYLEREIAMIPNRPDQAVRPDQTAETDQTSQQAREKVIEESARGILLTSLVCVGLFLAFAISGMTFTRVDERSAAYLIVGITVLVRNFNRLRIAVLQGSGDYDTAATLKTFKRLYLLGAVFVLLELNFPASYLMLGYLASEIGMLIKSFKEIRLPKVRILLKGCNKLRSTLEKSAGFILTDDALDVIFYMDFLILGFFVTSQNLGVYAQASILARIFLLIPMSIKPVFLGQYCSLASKNRLSAVAGSLKLSAAVLFFLHSVLALYILLFYSDIQQSLFHSQRLDMTSFYIFAQILPGLLFFSAVTSQEPLYEADGQVGLLQKKIILVAVINLCLNLFFVPFAGFFGAAFATSASMFVFFMVFGRHLDPVFTIDKMSYIFAGAAVYLTFMLFQALDWGFPLTFFSVPVFLLILLTWMGFFDVDQDRHLHPMDVFRLNWNQPETGGFDDGRQ
jgi:O-antigen/teichoic acid export membrane protein